MAWEWVEGCRLLGVGEAGAECGLAGEVGVAAGGGGQQGGDGQHFRVCSDVDLLTCGLRS